MKDRYISTPTYGYVPMNKIQFKDNDLFGPEMWKYQILSKVKLWYGTPKAGDENIKEKIVLGIQCVYLDTISGKKTQTEQHCGDITKDDVETKELELKESDFFNKFYIDMDKAITHIKLMTKNGESIEIGEEKEDYKRVVELNLSDEMQLIQSFFGYYNVYGLRALGCKYISKKNFVLISLMGILRLRHIFKTNKEEKEKWEKPEELNKLNDRMRTVAKLCALPDKTFFEVIKFCSL